MILNAAKGGKRRRGEGEKGRVEYPTLVGYLKGQTDRADRNARTDFSGCIFGLDIQILGYIRGYYDIFEY